MKRILFGSFIAAAAIAGIGLGSGSAEAKIEPGDYKSQQLLYGVVPAPESNYRVIGNRAYSDLFGLGPWNLYSYKIKPTKNGGVMYRDFPGGWLNRQDFKKTHNGYSGPNFVYGVPSGTAGLKRVR